MRSVFGQKVKSVRDAKGLQQEELAHRLGVSTQSVSAYETDKSIPRFKILQKLASEAGVPVAWFFLDEDTDEYELIRKSGTGESNKSLNEIDAILNKVNELQNDLIKLRTTFK